MGKPKDITGLKFGKLTAIKLDHKDKTLCISEWADIVGIDKDTLWMRIKRGWSIERAISTPVKTNQK